MSALKWERLAFGYRAYGPGGVGYRTWRREDSSSWGMNLWTGGPWSAWNEDDNELFFGHYRTLAEVKAACGVHAYRTEQRLAAEKSGATHTDA